MVMGRRLGQLSKLKIDPLHAVYILSIFVMALMSTYVMYDNYVYTNWINHNYNRVSCEYTEDSFAGIPIPDEVGVYLVSGVDDLYAVQHAQGTGMGRTIGTYNRETQEINILYDRDISEVASTLVHELAHHTYSKFTEEERSYIERRYNLYCQNPDEFYAYTVENYGEYKWLE